MLLWLVGSLTRERHNSCEPKKNLKTNEHEKIYRFLDYKWFFWLTSEKINVFYMTKKISNELLNDLPLFYWTNYFTVQMILLMAGCLARSPPVLLSGLFDWLPEY